MGLIKQIKPSDIYISYLTHRKVKNEEGWTKWVEIDHSVRPTGSMVMDTVAALLWKECLSCGLLAKRFEVTRGELDGAFRVLTGMAVADFLREYRLLRAKELLSSTDLTTTRITKLSGYVSQGSFSQLFRKHTGLSPVDYRAEHRPKNFRELYRW